VLCSAKIISAPSISCSNCLKVYHIICAKISKDEFDIINKQNMSWYCIKCSDNNDSGNIVNINDIKTLIIKLKSNLFEFKETVNKKSDNLDEIILENTLLKNEVSLL
jgi:hypothetical protein